MGRHVEEDFSLPLYPHIQCFCIATEKVRLPVALKYIPCLVSACRVGADSHAFSSISGSCLASLPSNISNLDPVGRISLNSIEKKKKKKKGGGKKGGKKKKKKKKKK